MQDPLVSICCITYNHAPFIRQALDGMLMQLTSFPVEILVHDDASTDGTDKIIQEYANRYPDLIFPQFESVNQYQNGKAGVIDFFNYKRARGKYVAYCEGDDFWIEQNKLQRQVDFMETHQEYSVCFHEVKVYNTSTRKYHEASQYSNSEDFDITADMFLNSRERLGQPLSMLFRFSCYDFNWQKHYSRYCDTMEIFHLLRVGKGRFMRFVGGQYNLQMGGVSAFNPDTRRSWESCEDFTEMWRYTHDPVVQKCCLNTYLWRLDVCLQNKLYREYWSLVLYTLRNNPHVGIIVLRKAARRFLLRK